MKKPSDISLEIEALHDKGRAIARTIENSSRCASREEHKFFETYEEQLYALIGERNTLTEAIQKELGYHELEEAQQHAILYRNLLPSIEAFFALKLSIRDFIGKLCCMTEDLGMEYDEELHQEAMVALFDLYKTNNESRTNCRTVHIRTTTT